MKADGLFIYPSMRNFLADGCRVDDCVADMQVIRRWIDALAAAARCVGRQQRGMHVRARTLENIQSDLEVGIEMLYDLLLTPRWAPYRASHAAFGGVLEAHVGASIHFLCLARTRVCDGAIPSDIWKKVILGVLPSVQDFHYCGSDVVMRVELSPALKALPTNAAAADELLDASDARKLQFLRNWWQCGNEADSTSDASPPSSPHVVPIVPCTPEEDESGGCAVIPSPSTDFRVTLSMATHAFIKHLKPAGLVADAGVLLRLQVQPCPEVC